MSFNIIDFLVSIVQLRVFDYVRAVWPGQAWVEPVLDLVGIIVVSTFCLLIVIYLIWWERRVIARLQDRIGPNRVGGKFGALQTVADVLKLLTKEFIMPAGADSLAYILAPLLIVMTALLMWAVLPFAPGVIGVDLNIGIFYVLSISSVSVVTLLLAGWGSNNKYALLGAFRSVAQLVSYEIPMVIALLVPILLARTMSTQGIISAQIVPFFLVVPLSAIIFFISALAETGRTPFDLLEAESEIVAGFHVEYTGMMFGMFFLAEFISTLFMSGLFATVYLGGWNIPLINLIIDAVGGTPVDLESLAFGRTLGLMIFFAKMFGTYFIFIWIRGTLPRVRIDQMLDINWKFLVPLSLVMLLVVAILDKIVVGSALGATPVSRAAVHLTSHIIIALGTLEVLRATARRQRRRAELDAELEAVVDSDSVDAAVAAAD